MYLPVCFNIAMTSDRLSFASFEIYKCSENVFVTGDNVISCNRGIFANDYGRHRRESLGTRLPFCARFSLHKRLHERLHAHNIKSFPLSLARNEINVSFLLNEYGSLYFLLRNFGVKMIFLKLKYIKEKFLDRKNGIAKMH